MKTRGMLSSDSYTLPVTEESWKTFLTYFVPASARTYQLVVTNRWKSEIYRSKFYATPEMVLRGLDDIRIRFLEMPFGLLLAVETFVTKDGSTVRTTVNLRPYVNASFNKQVFSVKPRVKQTFVPKLRATLLRSWNESRKKTPFVPRVRTQRVRSTPASRSYDIYVTARYTLFTPTYPDGLSYNYQVQVATQSVVGKRTANFKQLSKLGQLPNNPYSIVRARMTTAPFYRLIDYPGYEPPGYSKLFAETTGYLLLTDLSTGHLSVDENKLIAKLAAAVSHNAGANIGEDIATGRQTLKLFTNTVKKLTASVVFVRTGNINKAFSVLGLPGSKRAYRKYGQLTKAGVSGANLVSQMWLEMRYGWLPLVADSKAALMQFHRYVAKNPGVKTVKASITVRSESRVPMMGISSIFGQSSGYKYTQKRTTVTCGISYCIDSTARAAIGQLGITSPVSLAYELIPLSFVLDWAYPIGPALEAFHAFEGLGFQKGYITRFTKSNLTLNLSSGGSVPGLSESLGGGGSIDGVQMDRSVLWDFPSPSFPRLKNPISTIHAANAVALLVSAFTAR